MKGKKRKSKISSERERKVNNKLGDKDNKVSSPKSNNRWDLVKEILVIGIVIAVAVSCWTYLERTIENSISIIIIGSITIMASLATIRNKALYRVIVKECKEIETTESFIELNKQVQEKIERNPIIKVNIQAMIEEYISNKKDNRGKPLLEGIKGIKAIPSILIIMGVLGTFSGLVAGLRALGSGEMERLMEQIPHFLNGVHTAFYTSIAGIIASLFLQYMISKYPCEGEVVRWMLKLELLLNEGITDEAKKQMTKFMRETTERLDTLNESIPIQGKIQEEIEIVANEVTRFNEGLKAIKELKDVAEDLNGFNEVFGENIQTFTEVVAQSFDMMADFSSKITGVGELFELLHKEMQSQSKINEGITNTIQKTYQYLEQMTEGMEAQHQLQKLTYDGLLEQLVETKDQMRQVFEQSANFEQEKQNNMKVLLDEAQTFINVQNDNQQLSHEKIQSNIEASFTQMSQKLNQTMENVQAGMMNLQRPFTTFVGMIPERMNKLEENLRTQVESHQSVLTDMATREREHFEMQKITMEEMNGALEKQLASRDQKLVEVLEKQMHMLGELQEPASTFAEVIPNQILAVQEIIHTVEENLVNIDNHFAGNVEESFDTFKNYVEHTNKLLEEKIHTLYEGYLVDKLMYVIEQVEKEAEKEVKKE